MLIWVNIRAAAQRNEDILEGRLLDQQGEPTRSAQVVMAGSLLQLARVMKFLMSYYSVFPAVKTDNSAAHSTHGILSRVSINLSVAGLCSAS